MTPRFFSGGARKFVPAPVLVAPACLPVGGRPAGSVALPLMLLLAWVLNL
jgi:hypothetical protein